MFKFIIRKYLVTSFYIFLLLFIFCRPHVNKSQIPILTLIYKSFKTANSSTNNSNSPTTLTFAYPNQSYSFLLNVTISPISPKASTNVDSYSINPTLPSGLFFDTVSGQISGTPTVLSSTTNYTITATNSNNSANFTISIAVTNSPPTGLSYTGSPFSWIEYQSVNISPIVTGVVTSCSAIPALPAGLTLSSSCIISGAPTTVQSSISYSIIASNLYGSTSTGIDIAILAYPNKRIFVTSSGYTPGINFTNLTTADNLCNSDSAKPPGTGTYAAMIGVPIVRVACTLPNCPGGNGEHAGWIMQANTNYYQTDGVTLIATTDAIGLLPSNFINAATGNAKYWTGMNTDWTIATLNNCLNWTSNLSANFGYCGGSGSGTNNTTPNFLNSWGGSVGCNAPQQLICIQQ